MARRQADQGGGEVEDTPTRRQLLADRNYPADIVAGNGAHVEEGPSLSDTDGTARPACPDCGRPTTKAGRICSSCAGRLGGYALARQRAAAAKRGRSTSSSLTAIVTTLIDARAEVTVEVAGLVIRARRPGG